MKRFLFFFLIPFFCDAKPILPPDHAEFVSLKGSYLYWQSKMWGLEFGIKSFLPIDGGAGLENFKQKVFIPDFAFCSGFKIEVGGKLPHDGWNIEMRWTNLPAGLTNLKKYLHKKIVPVGEGIAPLWIDPLANPSSANLPLHFHKATGHWKFFFNSFDLELGRSFLPISLMPIRIFFGAKGAPLHQRYAVEYEEGPDFYDPGIFYLSSTMTFHSVSFGMGPRGGFASKWILGGGVSIIADGALSFLYTSSSLRTKFQNKFSNSAFDRSSQMKEKEGEIVPVAEGRLGFDWGGWFRERVYLGMTLAYEAQYWWAQNHTRRRFPFNAPGNLWDMRGDLQMRGLTASILVEF